MGLGAQTGGAAKGISGLGDGRCGEPISDPTWTTFVLQPTIPPVVHGRRLTVDRFRDNVLDAHWYPRTWFHLPEARHNAASMALGSTGNSCGQHLRGGKRRMGRALSTSIAMLRDGLQLLRGSPMPNLHFLHKFHTTSTCNRGINSANSMHASGHLVSVTNSMCGSSTETFRI